MIKSLTSLRGIFILFIFFHHCMNLYPGGGSMAVTFFFVLGGFSMTIGYKDRLLNPDFNYRQFITRRCIRFFPLHWLCLFLALPFAIMSFSWLDIPTFILNSLLLQTWIPIKSVYFSFNQVSWYLADTMFFAIMFPFFGKWIIKANRNKRSLIAILFVTLYTLVAVFLSADMYHAVLYISPYMRLVDFVFGIFLALGYLSLRERPAKLFTNSVLSQFLIICLIVLLVVESCIFENARCFSVIYWPLVALLILIATLSETTSGGGADLWKTATCND
ncbi:MAG: acyltransferase [Paludibacteraceae bacterium]|nr:acyltransferase [Paludibacteraceae bacterium]